VESGKSTVTAPVSRSADLRSILRNLIPDVSAQAFLYVGSSSLDRR